MKAVATLTSAEDRRTFSGIGDASPENVGRNIAPHLIRMAETRAKARALRDAVNVAATSLEELGDDNPEDRQQPAQSRQRPSQQAQQSGGQQEKDHLPATRKQLNFLETMIADNFDGGMDAWEQAAGKGLNDLTRREASDWIGKISGRAG